MNQIIPSPARAKKTQFNDTQTASLNALIDLLIPASNDGRMPAARSLDLFADISDMPSATRTLFENGLADLDVRAQQRYGRGFTQLNMDETMALVEELRSQTPVFIQSFMTQTTGRYLAHDTVVLLIGLEARPPWPKGHVVAQGDWSLLDVVKKRPKIYRKL